MLYCIQLVVLGRLVMFFVTPSLEVAQANLVQGSVPPLTATCHYLVTAFIMHRKGTDALRNANARRYLRWELKQN